jgi:hypothetical protein
VVIQFPLRLMGVYSCITWSLIKADTDISYLIKMFIYIQFERTILDLIFSEISFHEEDLPGS